MIKKPAELSKPKPAGGSLPFVPSGSFRDDPASFDYAEEEWFASGEVDGHPYKTTVLVRRPRDANRFSGTVVVEPVHAAGAAPIWIYTARYLMRSGHGWAAICSQKSALEAYVKAFDPARYAALEIWSDASMPDASDLAASARRDPTAMQTRMAQLRRMNAASTPILAQIGAALAAGSGPFAGFDVGHLILAGHSQTGGVVTDYILNRHDACRLDDGSPVYAGFFPSGSPSATFGPRDVPLVQVLSDGDISNPNRPGHENRAYRRPDSDDPGDRYRLYELAGMPHMGTRYPPYNDAAMWLRNPLGVGGRVQADAKMNSLPHGELFSAALHHLVQWVADDGITPPRADRIAVGADGFFARDDLGNTVGGVRCPQMDVPRSRYFANPGTAEDGSPAFGVVGIEEPLPKATLERLYHDHADYVDRFNRRLQELVAAGWLLPEDADEMREEAEHAAVP